jgi:hypothetical protein
MKFKNVDWVLLRNKGNHLTMHAIVTKKTSVYVNIEGSVCVNTSLY